MKPSAFLGVDRGQEGSRAIRGRMAARIAVFRNQAEETWAEAEKGLLLQKP